MGATQSSEPLSESQHAREVRYMKGLEEEKAAIISLEQQLEGQPSSEYLQDSLASARWRQKCRQECLSMVWDLREHLPRDF